MPPVAVALTSVVLSSCSGASGNEGSGAYQEVLQGLDTAAHSSANYHAVRRAKNLEPADEAVIEGFCRAIREMALSGEDPHQLIYASINSRIGLNGQMELREMKLGVDPHRVRAAMEELREVIDLESLNVNLNRAYVKGCYKPA